LYLRFGARINTSTYRTLAHPPHVETESFSDLGKIKLG